MTVVSCDVLVAALQTVGGILEHYLKPLTLCALDEAFGNVAPSSNKMFGTLAVLNREKKKKERIQERRGRK